MIHNLIKWSLIISLAGGLCSCFMYDDNSRHENRQNAVTYEQQQPVAKQAQVTKAVVKANNNASIATEPVQKTTPGPKRAAAPQLPVIQ